MRHRLFALSAFLAAGPVLADEGMWLPSQLPDLAHPLAAAGYKGDPAALLERRNWPRAVVKPAVSASAYGTWRTSLEAADSDQGQWDEEVEQRSLLVQPFTDEIVTSGEWSVVFFDGHYSHAVLKKPASGDFRVQEELGGHAEPLQPSRAVIDQARHALTFVEGPLLYARVDGVERDGQFLLMELEVNEPVLYLASSRDAAERFALAIARSVTAPLHG